GAAAFMICHGHESWHPAPEFYYQTGGGPMMDMGPYYLTALVNLMGSVKGLTGIAKKNFEHRVITSEPLYGKTIDVEVPTHYNGILDFESGATATVTTTFDVYYTQQARFEIYGTEGTLIVPDPNTFGGPVKLLSGKENEYRDMPLLFDYSENSRGLGLSNMADALRGLDGFRANGDQMLHVLEIMTGFEKSSSTGCYLEMDTRTAL
ncbi:Gfo/Idh/MocA family oxidoreductase, partial [uncultured Robinsoniella sp.]|uniref:Gfo/Idh/MocA family protein n=1 Tax=uncultured Robinsoniella sp. TaxID=904190 RepID=UPI00374F7FB7